MKKLEEKESHGLSWPTKEPRARTEWDFRPLWKGCNQKQFPFEFLSPEDVWYCHWYEFDRTLPRTVENVLEWRGKSPAQPLFTDKAEWSRAVKAAEELLFQYS